MEVAQTPSDTEESTNPESYSERGSRKTTLIDNDTSVMTHILSMPTNRYHTCVVFSDQTVSCIGKNDYGQLGSEIE